MLLVTLCLIFVHKSTQHNWINSISRSATASTTRPTVPSSTNKPHVTVAPGQAFQLEYMTGHGEFTYLFVQSAKDKDKLGTNTKSLVQELLKNPPAGQDVPLRGKFEKHHRQMRDELHAKKGQNLFASLTKHGDPGYITRETIFDGILDGANQPGHRANEAKFNSETVKTIIQAEYKPEHTANDRRFTFYDKRHDDYPWLLEVRQYHLVSGEAGEMDVVLFEFPEGTPLGHYMIYYNYNGYYDVVDVEVVATPAENIYGKPPPPERRFETPEYLRIDHCAFNVDQTVGSCQIITTNIDACKRMCNRVFYSQCTGVQVIPAFPPAGSLDVNLYNEFLEESEEQNKKKCPSDLLEDAKPGDFICVPIFAKLPTETEQRFRTTNDPIAPEYYSTCHIRQRVENDPPPPPPRERKWRHERKCVSCKAAAAAQREEQLWVDWSLNPPQHCINCDLEPVDMSSLKPVFDWTAYDPWKEEIFSGALETITDVKLAECGFPRSICGRHNFCAIRCTLNLNALSGLDADMSAVDCAIAAKKNKWCDTDVISRHYRRDLIQTCGCWAKRTPIDGSGGCCPAPEFPMQTAPPTLTGQKGVFRVRDDMKMPDGPLGGNDALL